MNNTSGKNRKSRSKDDYSVFMRHIKEEKEDTSNFAKTLFVVVIFVGALVFGLFMLSDNESLVKKIFGEDSMITQKILEFAQSRKNRLQADFGLPFMPHKQNILLLGVDSNGSDTDPWRGTRSDTIILMNIDPRTKSVNAISIPRDSKVYLPGDNGVQKINSAHAIGGVEMTKRTIEQTLGVKINKYIIVHDDGVAKIINALGGISIYVEKNMHYNDNAGNLHINLTKGLNVLDGRSAVGYLRFRHDGLGDIGRTQRQQWFMRGLLEKLKTPQTVAKIPEILKIAGTYVKTDLSLYELSQYAAMSKSFDMDSIEIATLPGAPNKHGYTSYWILDPEKTQDVVNRLIYREKTDVVNESLVAGIMYVSSKEQEAMKIKSELEAAGLKVNCMGSSRLPHSQFVANSSSVSREFFNWLKEKVPEIKGTQFVYDPVKNFCVNSDFTIIISGQ